MENRYHGQWIVPLSHCDETGRLSVQGALGEFMDIAALHAEQIGVGGADMAKRGLFWLTVRTEGSGEGIDRPAGVWPDLHMSWIPIWSKSCVRCGGRLAEGELPYCVNACPNGALSVGDAAAGECEALRQRGFRIFKLPAWENAADNVVYASKG